MFKWYRRTDVLKSGLLLVCLYGAFSVLKSSIILHTLKANAVEFVESYGNHRNDLRTTSPTNVMEKRLDAKWSFREEDDPPASGLAIVTNNHITAPTVPPVPGPVSIVRGNPAVCHSSRNIKWIIYVHTAPKNIKKRYIIRSTWGNKHLFRNQRTAIIFLVGLPRNDVEKEVIDQEYKRYGDLVQGDFIEHYRNLTYKGILGLQFIVDHCSHVPYVIKSDDDVFANIFNIMQLTERQGSDQRFLMCYRWSTMPIQRPGGDRKLRKWWLDNDLLPGRTIFPPYCAGLGWIFSTNIVKDLLDISKSTPFLWVDDVYISGVVMNQVSALNIIDLLTVVPQEGVLGQLKRFNSSKYVFTHKAPSREFWIRTLYQLDDSTLKSLNSTVLKRYPILLKKRGNVVLSRLEKWAHLLARPRKSAINLSYPSPV